MRNTRSIFGAVALVATVTGCGGGGDSSGAAPATELAFTVAWEQRLPAATSASSSGEAAAFDTPIPPSVGAIRFLLRPGSGPACCVAVLRGSQPFEDRHLLLADVPVGVSTLEVHGFPTDFAPNDGVTGVCPTAGQGVPCSNQDTLPSFGSDLTPVDVVQGVRNVVNMDVYSLPFLIDLDPDDGETADDARPHARFTVVDANHDIASGVLVRLSQGEATAAADLLSSEPCRDDDPSDELPDCSNGGALDVRGLRIVSRAPQQLAAGTAGLHIEASNTAVPSRTMESDTTFVVPGVVTTSTTTSTMPSTTSSTETTTTSSTTSTTETTTTTLGAQTYCLRFSVSNAVDLVGISYVFDYSQEGGNIAGSGVEIPCESLLGGDALATFNDEDQTGLLNTAIIRAAPFAGPVELAFCEFTSPPPLNLAATSIQVTEATAPDLSPANANVVVEEIACPF